MTFLEAVNRVLRSNGILAGDDDDILTFAQTQHLAMVNLCVIAIQDELTDLISDELIPYERTTGSITTSSGARTYALPSNFVQMYGKGHLTLSDGTLQVFEYAGGLEQLQVDFINYLSQTSAPTWWYFEPTTTKTIAFFPTPNVVQTWNYDYEKDVSVTLTTDTLPFHNAIEAQAFCGAAGRRFKFMYEDAQNTDTILKNDASYISAKGRLMRLMTGKNPGSRYSKIYA